MRTIVKHLSEIAFVFILLAVQCSTLSAQTLPQLGTPESKITATALAGTGTGLMRVGWRPSERVSVFGQGVWLRDIASEDIEGYGGHVGATYDIVAEQQRKILNWEVPTTWYAGAIAGAIRPESTGWETSPGILTGMTFGDRTVRVVVEGWALPGSSVSEAFANINDKFRLLVGAEFRF